MVVQCDKCGRTIPEENISVVNMNAECVHCMRLFSIKGSPKENSSQDLENRPAELPDNMKIENDGNRLKITRKWLGKGLHRVAFIFFTVCWTGFLLFSLVALFFVQGDKIGGEYFAFLALGVGFVYYWFALILNVTKVTVSKNRLFVKHGPIPWPSRKPLHTKDIRQLYVRKKISYSKKKGRVSAHYQLRTKSIHGKDRMLVKGFSTSDQARFMEHEIEKYLGIENEAVKGEMS